jgi:hypothetical protein
MEKRFVFPAKCCVCMTECHTQHELALYESIKEGFSTKVTTTKLSVPVCNKCRGKFKKINYGWLTWFALISLGAVIGFFLGIYSPTGNIGAGIGIVVIAFGVIGIFPALMVSIKYGHKTNPPAFIGRNDGRPVFSNKEYQYIFDELNPR